MNTVANFSVRIKPIFGDLLPLSKERFAFVLMPFDDSFSGSYESITKPIVKRKGLDCQKGGRIQDQQGNYERYMEGYLRIPGRYRRHDRTQSECHVRIRYFTYFGKGDYNDVSEFNRRSKIPF